MSLGGIVSGLVSSGQDLPTVDIAALLETIKKSGANQRELINGLPPQIQQALAVYQQQNAKTAADYQTNVQGQGADYLSKVKALYDPNSEANVNTLAAMKTNAYSTVPGSQDAIREALAATGGLQRGHTGTALAQPIIAAATGYGKDSAALLTANNQAGQQATQQALAKVNSMNEEMFSQLFGMSRQQAQTILTTGNDALKEQLAQLITQSTNETNQTLGVQGIAANNAYQNAVTRNAQESALWGDIADTGLQGIQAGLGAMGGMPGGGSGLPVGADTSSAAYYRNMNGNRPAGV